MQCRDVLKRLLAKCYFISWAKNLVPNRFGFGWFGKAIFLILDTLDRPTPSSAATFSTDLPCCRQETISLFTFAERGLMMGITTKICERKQNNFIKIIFLFFFFSLFIRNLQKTSENFFLWDFILFYFVTKILPMCDVTETLFFP